MDRLPGAAGPRARWTAVIDEPAILAAIERTHETWQSAEAIADEAGIPLDRVQFVLDAAPSDIIIAPGAGGGGRALYSTRTHYRRTTGLFRRYIEALVQS